MRRGLRLFVAGALLTATGAAGPAFAQKSGGVLGMPIGNSPASMSIHEEATRIAVTPMMAVFNNLVIFDQHVRQNTFESIRPELAETWSWDEDKTALTFRLHTGVKWHDGKPFTARDVKCTWDMLTGKGSEKLRVNPRRSWYRNLTEITVNGDDEVTFHLQRPQPSLLALLASGASPVYPCQVPQAICELVLDNGSRTMIVNRAVPPFDNPELRRAMALSIDRKAFVDILTEGHGALGGAMLPPPEGVWGMPPEVLATLPGYTGDMQQRRAEARAIMEKLGYGPAKR